jgi:hypothetical protein
LVVVAVVISGAPRFNPAVNGATVRACSLMNFSTDFSNGPRGENAEGSEKAASCAARTSALTLFA